MRKTSLLAFATAFVVTAFASSFAEARETVRLDGYRPGTIVVRTSERRLYLVVDDGVALRYPVGVGKKGKAWSGTARIDGKYRNPAWAPPPAVRRDKPNLPDVIPGGSPRNPMGVAALTLTGGEYAIHGTNVPSSIGGRSGRNGFGASAVSPGCGAGCSVVAPGSPSWPW